MRFITNNASRRVAARTRLQCLTACFQSNLCQTVNYFAEASFCDLFFQFIDQGQIQLEESIQTIFHLNNRSLAEMSEKFFVPLLVHAYVDVKWRVRIVEFAYLPINAYAPLAIFMTIVAHVRHSHEAYLLTVVSLIDRIV